MSRHISLGPTSLTLPPVCRQGITVDDDFVEALGEMTSTHPDLEAVYDVVPLKPTKVDAIDVIMTFLQENNTTPEELFDVTDAYEDRLISHEDFVDKLRVGSQSQIANCIGFLSDIVSTLRSVALLIRHFPVRSHRIYILCLHLEENLFRFDHLVLVHFWSIIGIRAFALCNWLPSLENFTKFRHHLKTYLYNLAYPP